MIQPSQMLITMPWHTSGILLRVGPSSAIAVSGHVQVPTILCIVSRIVLLWVIRHHMELKISNSFQIRLISPSTLITANSRAIWTSGHVSKLKWVSSSLTVKIRTLLTDLSSQYTLDSKVQIWTTKLIASWITFGMVSTPGRHVSHVSQFSYIFHKELFTISPCN